MSPSEPYGIRHALNELSAIFEAQWANGLLPQIRFVPGQTGYRPNAADWGVTPAIAGQDRVTTSGITQPPIMGRCAHIVYHRLRDPRPYLGELLALVDGLERFHAFLLTERDPFDEGLVVCLHPWETGTDNSPAFEALLQATRAYLDTAGIPVDTFGRADTVHVRAEHRPTARDYVAYFGLLALFKQHNYDQRRIAAETPFLLQDVLFNSTLADSLAATADLEDDLAALTDDAELAAKLRAQAAVNRARRERLAASIRRTLWSDADGFFYARDARQGELLPVPTVSSFMPLLSGIAAPDQAQRLLDHLRDPAEFWPAFPVPSTALDHPLFDPLRYWAGPSWPVPNWLLTRALPAHDAGLAARLRERTLTMLAEGEGDPMRWRERAAQTMQLNSVGGRTTTPSRGQYQHAWLWDSAIAAVGWAHVGEPPVALDPASPGPLFWEYYHPLTGEPLGAKLMTWSAAVYLDLLDESRNP